MIYPLISLEVPVFPHLYIEGVVGYARAGSSPAFGTINKRGVSSGMG